MMPRYRLTRSAKRDLQEISDYWSERASPDIALQIVTDIVETIIILATQPKMGATADQFGVGVRKFPAGKYVIYYRSYPKRVEILHLFHGAREQRKAWKSETKKKAE